MFRRNMRSGIYPHRSGDRRGRLARPCNEGRSVSATMDLCHDDSFTGIRLSAIESQPGHFPIGREQP